MDFIEIFRLFNKNRIKYIVVGGVAINLHGIPRMTYDIDILIDEEDKNIKQLINLLKRLEYYPKVPVDPEDFAKKEKREKWIREKNMRAFNFYNEKAVVSEIDIIINSPVKYKEAIKNVVKIPISNIVVPIISIDDLILMKKYTKRLQDRADIRSLNKLRRK